MTARAVLAALSLSMATGALADDQARNADEIFHYSVMDALRNGVYQGALTVKDVASVGDFGLGTFNNLDGELVGLDGVIYRIAPDGKVAAAEADRKIPFGSFTFFKADKSTSLNTTGSFDDLQQQLLEALPSRNHLYAVRITGTFPEVVAGGSHRVADDEKTPLAEILKTRPQYSAKNVKGTVVGYYSPPYVGGIDLAPFHLHFISDDKTFGGHILSMTLTGGELQLSLDQKKGLDISLPHESPQFLQPWKSDGTARKGY
jgi:acetolactate decarboxylase